MAALTPLSASCPNGHGALEDLLHFVGQRGLHLDPAGIGGWIERILLLDVVILDFQHRQFQLIDRVDVVHASAHVPWFSMTSSLKRLSAMA